MNLSNNLGNNYGFYIAGSNIIFDNDIVANNNTFIIDYSLITSNSNVTFNGTVSVTNDLTGGIHLGGNDETIFNKEVNVLNNNFAGIIAGKIATFNDKVKSNYNGKANFSGNNEKSGLLAVGTVIFNDDVEMINNEVEGISLRGSAANAIFNNDKLIVLDNILPNINNSGKVTFTGAPTLNCSIGSASLLINKVQFSSNNTVKRTSINNDIYTNNLTLGGLTVGIDSVLKINAPITTNTTIFDLTKDLTIEGNLIDGSGNGITIKGAGNLIIAGNNTINTAIAPTVTNSNTILFTGAPAISKDLGSSTKKLNSVAFTAAAGNTVNLTKDIYANALSFAGLTAKINSALTFDSSVTTASTIFDLTNASLKIVGNLTDGGNTGVTLVGNNDLIFSGNNTLNDVIIPNASNSGKIVFSNAPIINSILGSAAKKLNSVSFTAAAGNTVTLTKDIYTNAISFAGLTAKVNAALTFNSTVTTASTIFDLAQNLTITGAITDSNNGGLTISGANSLILAGNSPININIKPSTNGNGNIVFTDGPTINSMLGTSSSVKLSSVKFTNTNPLTRASLKNDIFTNSLSFAGLTVGIDTPLTFASTTSIDKTIFDLSSDLTINGTITDTSSNGMSLYGAGKLIILGNNSLNIIIKGNTDGVGNVSFSGAPTINKDLGTITKKLNSVAFTAAAGNTVTLTKNIYTNTMSFAGLTTKINSALTFDSAVNTASTIFDLAQNLTITGAITDSNNGGLTISGVNSLILAGNSPININIKPTTNGNGNIVFTDGPTINSMLGTSSSVKLSSVKFTNTNPLTRTSLKNDIFTNSLYFAGLTVGIDAPLTFASTISIDKTIFDLSSDLTINGTIIDASSNGMSLYGAGKLIISGNNALNIGIKGNTDGVGNVSFSGAPTISKDLGSATKKLNSVAFTAAAGNTVTLTKDIYTNAISFSGLTAKINTPLTFNSAVTTASTIFDLAQNLTISGAITDSNNGGLTISGANSLILVGNSPVNINVKPTSNGNGNLIFADDPTINAVLGTSSVIKLSSIKFTNTNPATRASLKNSIFTNSLEFGGLTVGVDGPISIASPTKIDKTIFDLTNSSLMMSGAITDVSSNGISIKGANSLTIDGNNAIDYTIKPLTDDTINGNIIITGSPVINNPLGTNSLSLASLTINNANSATRVSLKQDIFPHQTLFDTTTIGVDAPSNIASKLSTNKTTLDLVNDLTIKNDLTNNDANGPLIIGGSGSLIFKFDNIIDAKIASNIDGVGNVIFTDGPTIKQRLGTSDVARLASVKFTSVNPVAKAYISDNIYAKNIELGSLSVVSKSDALSFNGDIVTKNTIFDLTSNNFALNGPITNSDVNGAINVTGSKTFYIQGNNIINAAIMPSTNGVGVLEFTDAPTLNYAIGSAVAKFATVKFSSNNVNKRASFNKNISANSLSFDQLTVGVDSPVTLDGAITTNNTTFDLSSNDVTITNNITNLDANGAVTIKGSKTMIFDGNNVINARLLPDITEVGALKFTGDPVLNFAIGSPTKKFGLVEFTNAAPNSKITLNNDIYTKSSTIVFGKQTAFPSKNITLVGTVSASDTIFDLQDKIITIDGKLTHRNANGGVVINTTYNGTSAGHFVLTGNSNVDLSNANKLTFNVTESANTPLPVVGVEMRVDMFETNGGTLIFVPNNQVLINSSNKLVSWRFDEIDGALLQKLNIDPAAALPAIVKGGALPVIDPGPDSIPPPPPLPPITGSASANQQKLEERINFVKNNPALAFDLLNIYKSEGARGLQEALERLDPNTAGNIGLLLSKAAENLSINDVTQVVVNRIAQVASLNQDLTYSEESFSGVSAGEVESNCGLWMSPFFGKNTQKLRKTVPGYQSTYYGLAVGFDGAINDQLVLGAAVSTIQTDIKHKDYNVGDRTKINSNIIYVYVTYSFNDHWFLQNVTSAGKSRIKNRELRKESLKYNTAKADYNSSFIATEILTGYKYSLQNKINITPTLAVNYTKSGDISFSETGTQYQNLIVKGKGGHQLATTFGVIVDKTFSLSNGFKIKPEIYGDVGYTILTPKADLDIRLAKNPTEKLNTSHVKPDKMLYSFGGNITGIISKSYEINVGYDCKLADKFVAHQGTLRLRVNF